MNIPILKNVEPEDIEDVSNRYVHMFTEERNSDVVKKVRLKGNETSFYLISLNRLIEICKPTGPRPRFYTQTMVDI